MVNVRVESLTKKWGLVTALRDVSMEFNAGEIAVVLGPNGAGKTTLLLCLSGVALPSSGRILHDGEVFERSRLDMRRRIAFLPDVPLLTLSFTPLEHIAMALKVYGVYEPGQEKKVADILANLDLLPLCGAKIKTLSRGQQYKTALAALLAVDPDVWLLDEPLASGMDPAGIRYFREQAREAAERGRTIIYTTQMASVAESFSDRFCLLARGEVAASGDVASLRSDVLTNSKLEDIVASIRG